MPLFTQLRGTGILRTSENSVNTKFAESDIGKVRKKLKKFQNQYKISTLEDTLREGEMLQ